MSRIEVIVNAAGGSFIEDHTEDLLREAFKTAGVEIDLKLAANGREIEAFAKAAANGDAQVVVAGGGDGTISTVASAIVGSGKTFGVLPLGTLNNFSKDLGIPQDIETAVGVIASGRTIKIDVAEVNGRLFINNSSIGFYPRIVKDRDKQREKLGYGKWYAAFWATLRLFRFSPFIKVGIRVNGKFFLRKTPFVFVGNNSYEMDLYKIGRRKSLSEGQLSVYFLHRGGRLGVLQLLFRTMTGTIRQWRDFEQVMTDTVAIQTRRKKLPVAFDGEVEVVKTPLHYRIVPNALTVLAPPEEESDA